MKTGMKLAGIAVLLTFIFSTTLAFIFSCNKEKEKEYMFAGLQIEQPTVVFKFDSIKTNKEKYVLGVFARSTKQDAEIFGINLRFCYDASQFKNIVTVKNFKGGYGLTSLGQPRVATGSLSSKIILGTDGAMTYVNGAVQLNSINDSLSIKLDTAKYSYLFDIELIRKDTVRDANKFPVVWDKMNDPAYGGFLRGSDGLVCTILANDSTTYQTAPTIERGENRNWLHKLPQTKEKYPYGIVIK